MPVDRGQPTGCREDELCLGDLFYAHLHVEQAVFSLEKADWSLDAAEWCRCLRIDNQVTKVLSRLHAGLRLRLPVASSTCRISPFPIAAGLFF